MLATATDPWLVNDVVLPGAVSLVVTLIVLVFGWLWNARQQRRADDARLFANAYAAVQNYKEFPYVVRRRDPEHSGSERVRISEELRRVQSDIAFCTAWIGLRNGKVAAAYNELVTQTRRIAGRLMREAWERPGTDSDAHMNIPELHGPLSELQRFEETFLTAVKKAR